MQPERRQHDPQQTVLRVQGNRHLLAMDHTRHVPRMLAKKVERMKYFYDLEFLEDGTTIMLISIAIVAEDGREYYAVNSDTEWDRVRNHPWLAKNVWPHLPVIGCKPDDMHFHTHPRNWGPWGRLDSSSTLLRPKWLIANEVREFLTADPYGEPELWAYYGAYDHVCLMQLWGSMIKKPEGLPMWTHDINQLAETVGIDGEQRVLPTQEGTAHNALDDARHVKTMWQALDFMAASEPR